MDVKKEEDQTTMQTWFHNKWEIIHKSPWLTLPEQVIKWAIKLKSVSANIGEKVIYLIPDKWQNKLISFFFIPGLLILCSFYLWGLKIALIVLLLCLPYLMRAFKVWEPSGRLKKIGLLYLLFIYGGAFVLALKTALVANIYIAAVIMLGIIPLSLLWITPLFLMERFIPGISLKVVTEDLLVNFSYAMGISFFITFLAMSIGHIVSPDSWIPQKLQVLLFNVFFDGITLVATFYILEKFVKPPYLIRIPLAIAVDIFVAAVLACASLYFGLIFTDKALTIAQVFNVLIGKSPSGGWFEFGPFFWTMHTTFIPTACYLFVMLLCWLAKFMLVPFHLFFGAAKTHKHPLRLTAALCGIFVAVFTALSFAAATAEEKAKQHIKVSAYHLIPDLPGTKKKEKFLPQRSQRNVKIQSSNEIQMTNVKSFVI